MDLYNQESSPETTFSSLGPETPNLPRTVADSTWTFGGRPGLYMGNMLLDSNGFIEQDPDSSYGSTCKTPTTNLMMM